MCFRLYMWMDLRYNAHTNTVKHTKTNRKTEIFANTNKMLTFYVRIGIQAVVTEYIVKKTMQVK